MHKAADHAKRGLPLRHLPAMDLPFLMLVLTLVGFGLVMLGSASSAVALYRRGDAFAYLRPQRCMLRWASGPCGWQAGWTTIFTTSWHGRCWRFQWCC